MDLGWSEVGLNVRDIKKSLDFYSKLGFRIVDGDVENRAVTIQCGDCRIALYQGYIAENFINFRGGDCFGVAEHLKKQGVALDVEPRIWENGSTGGPKIRDPDGNQIYFCHYPAEVRKV
ncbi:MAG TPA: VOC family protein [Alphaproteobacteria bacterium]|nr:VOC family protein [Alphaproteobacteria bacterium]